MAIYQLMARYLLFYEIRKEENKIMKDTIVKRLDQAGDVNAKTKKHAGKKDFEFYTKQVMDRKEAIDSKLKLLHGSFFGKQIVKFDIGRVTDVWVPYCYLEYDFRVERNVMFKRKGLVKEGVVAVVLDVNEMHPFQYDYYESGELPLIKGRLDTSERTVIQTTNSFREMQEKSEDYIQFKIMKKFYGRNAQLAIKRRTIFYRPAVELEIIYKGQYPNMRYAYLDEFAVESEHVLGLKYRVENNF